MIHLIYERETGVVVGHLDRDTLPPILNHHATIAVPGLVDYQSVVIVDGAVVDLPPDLPDMRARRWRKVKAARDAAEWSGCTTQLGRVDTDPDSQRKVSGSVQMAMIAQAAGVPFDLAWTMQDNRSVMHDADAMIGMGVAVGRHVAACHAVALAKRAVIDAADTAEAIAAVDIEGGWPDAPIA